MTDVTAIIQQHLQALTNMPMRPRQFEAHVSAVLVYRRDGGLIGAAPSGDVKQYAQLSSLLAPLSTIGLELSNATNRGRTHMLVLDLAPEPPPDLHEDEAMQGSTPAPEEETAPVQFNNQTPKLMKADSEATKLQERLYQMPRYVHIMPSKGSCFFAIIHGVGSLMRVTQQYVLVEEYVGSLFKDAPLVHPVIPQESLLDAPLMAKIRQITNS